LITLVTQSPAHSYITRQPLLPEQINKELVQKDLKYLANNVFNQAIRVSPNAQEISDTLMTRLEPCPSPDHTIKEGITRLEKQLNKLTDLDSTIEEVNQATTRIEKQLRKLSRN
jgi:hypothetical protein